jgi:hypothetical protein
MKYKRIASRRNAAEAPIPSLAPISIAPRLNPEYNLSRPDGGRRDPVSPPSSV